MIFKSLRNILVSSIIITKFVKAIYIFESPHIPNENDCFELGQNSNDNSKCKQFIGYFLPKTDKYSDYTSFSSYISSVILNDDILNREFLQPVGCNGSASSISSREEMFCSYVLYDAITNNRCQGNNSFSRPSNYICSSKCLNYVNQMKSVCPSGSYGNSGINILEDVCSDFKNCGDIKAIPNSVSTKADSKNEQSTDSNKLNPSLLDENKIIGGLKNNNNNKVNVTNSNLTNSNTQSINTQTVDVRNQNQNQNQNNNNNSNNSNNNNNGNNNSIRTDDNDNNSNTKYDNSTERNGDNDSINKNILYTLGFMVPISLFVGFGFIYYRKKANNKPSEFDKESYSYHIASNHSSGASQSLNSISSSIGNSQQQNKVFPIGVSEIKNVPITIPITNKNIEEQDNMATNCVAELISTATMINAANNANNNIQPITPNEVNISVNTRYNTLNSYHSSNSPNVSGTSSLSNSIQTSSSSYNKKLPSYVINQTRESNNTSLNVNINPVSLKPNISTQINLLSPKSPDSEASPIVDLSISHENDPLLHIRKTNSFYHSSVSSESKKYNSFISPISPIMTERTSVIHSNDGKEKRESYTNHLLTNSILVANKIDEEFDEEDNGGNENNRNHDHENENDLNSIDEENIGLEEENSNLRPSKIFSTEISDINNVENSSTRFNNGISITIDNVDVDDNNNPDISSSRSSKYSSAKIPLSVMTVVQEFEPRMEDELALQINDRILLLKVFDDGWAVGLNQMTGKQGVFPMEYVVSSELIKSTNKFASQIEYRNVLPSRTQSQAFSNISFTSTTINDSVIHLTDCDFDYTTSMSKSQSLSSSKYYTKSSVMDGLRKSRINNKSIIEN